MGISYYVVFHHLYVNYPRMFFFGVFLFLAFLWGSYVLLFHKMDVAPVWAILPFVNEWKLYEAVWGDGYFSLFQLVPYFGFCFRLVMLYKTGRSFGKEGAAMVFAVLLPTFARYYFALGHSEYLGPEGRPHSENPYKVP